MAQDAVPDVCNATERIHEITTRMPGNRVYGQVASSEVILDRDPRVRMELETVVAGRCLTFGAGERILFAGFRVQEDGEILANLLRGTLASRDSSKPTLVRCP
jgi:hypothetical protein